jgi:hypothetical protein
VNGQHLRTFIWLHWRLRVNQFKRGGTVNAVLAAIVLGLAAVLAVVLFAVFFLIGLLALADAQPLVLLYVWDGLVVGFLFLWAAGLVAELQRSEAIALEKFLHLPVSLASAFVLNYLASLVSLSMILFVPAMTGLALGLIVSRGPIMLLALPATAAFLHMITAISYQFQGWLASLMVNKRRRRTVVVLVTAVFVLIFQLPNLINMYQPWNPGQADVSAFSKKMADLDRALAARAITVEEYQRRQQEVQRQFQARNQERGQRLAHQVEGTARLLNLVLPPGWLPLGIMGLAQGDALPALLGTLGLTLIGAASLGRAYRTTLRLYTGQYTSQRRTAADPVRLPGPSPTGKPEPARLLERQLPWVSEQAAAITLAGFRSLARAPEVKMLLLTPVIMAVVFGAVFVRGPSDLPEAARPLLPFAAVAMVLLTTSQLVINQFGFDRSGFRVFVLCPARRSDILLGKNLAAAPLALVLALIAVVVVEVLYPLRLDHLLAVMPQAVSMYLLFCLLANWLSILAPMPVAQGSLKPANTRMLPMLLHILFMFLAPVIFAPALVPLGIEVALELLGWRRGLPVYLILALLECLAVIYLYRFALIWQGGLLQAREQRILEIVTTKAE